MNNIHLIGVNHGDLKVGQRTTMALEQERPSAVAIECDEKNLIFLMHRFNAAVEEVVENWEQRTISEKAQKNISNVVNAACGEMRACIKYALESGIMIYAVDTYNSASLEDEVEMYKSLSDEALESFLLFDRKQSEQDYARFQEIFDNPSLKFETAVVNAEQIDESTRDYVVAENLGDLINQRYERIVYVCGSAHLLNDASGGRLYAMLLQKKADVSRATVRLYDDPAQLREEGKIWSDRRKQCGY